MYSAFRTLAFTLLDNVGDIIYSCLIFRSTTTAGPTNYDRSSRLKGRDEGGIRWVELLEKFRGIQEKARRSQRPGREFDDSFGMLDPLGGDGLDARGSKAPSPSPMPAKDLPAAPVGTQAQAQKSKSSLGKFGRLGGAVSGSRAKR